MARLFKRTFSLAFARLPKGEFSVATVQATVVADLRVPGSLPAGRFDCRINGRHTLTLEFPCELDDQNRVLSGKRNH